MIVTLPITILLESAVAFLFCVWRGKPLRPILITSSAANILTQSLLWIALRIFFRHYLATLAISEILIWTLEGVTLHAIKQNELGMREAFLLSTAMNICSFGAGIFLPI